MSSQRRVAALRTVDDHGRVYRALVFICPGCVVDGDKPSGLHMLPVDGDVGSRPRWDFDGNLEAPTLSPSILTRMQGFVCHSFLRAGMFEFLGDCTHSLAGQTAPIPELPQWVS